MKRIAVFFLGALVMAVIIAAFSLGKAAAATGCFADTNAHWAEAYICWLKDYGISTGYPDGTFKPENAITRAEMAAMLKRANASSSAERGDPVLSGQCKLADRLLRRSCG